MTYLTCKTCISILKCQACGKEVDDPNATLITNQPIPRRPKRYIKRWFFVALSFVIIASLLGAGYVIYNTNTTSAGYVLNNYCHAIVQGDYLGAYTNFSDKHTLTSGMTFDQFNRAVREAKDLGIDDCASTVIEHTPDDQGMSYAEGVIEYSYKHHTRVLIHQYGLFKPATNHTWRIDTSYWPSSVNY